MRGLVDDLVALPGQVLADQRQQLVNAASGLATQAIGAGIAKGQVAFAQASRTTIMNAVVAALLVAGVIAGAKLAWSYAHAK